jgi:cell division protein FtsB
MLEGFVGLITSRLAGPILGSLLLASLIGNAYQGIHDHSVISELRNSVSTLQHDNDRLRLNNAILKANQATLQSGIAVQNSAVDGLKSAADLSAAQAKASQATFNAAASTLDAQAAVIGKLPPLPAGADHCAAASKLIRDTLAAEHGK